ncbi:hypothetical protein EBB07_02935 [Paenibacillaceae bacterium]|nr:hypothetical protein EBB07_02935 [Paenibacillaceae bacterium]
MRFWLNYSFEGGNCSQMLKPISLSNPAGIRSKLMPVLFLILLFIILLALPQMVKAAGQTYYIDNSVPATCSDNGGGTDPEAPWCSFTPLNNVNLEAGDRLLIARGTSYAEQVNINNPRGTASDPVVIEAYGEGPRPRFVANGTNTAMTITNGSHLIVRNLDIGDTTVEGKGAFHYGLRVDFSTLDNSNVVFEDLFLHDNRVTGMFVRSTTSLLRTDTVLDGVTLRNIETTRNAHGIVFANQGTVTDRTPVASPETAANRIFRNVLIENLWQHDDNNNNLDPSEVFAQIDAGCPDSLSIGSASSVMIRNSIFDGSAGCRTNSGTAALYLGSVKDVVVANNIFVNTPNTRNPDMVAIDHEAGTNNVLIAGNYFADNYGGGIEYLAIHGSNDFSTGNAIRANVFVRNGYIHNIPYLGGGSISTLGNGIVPDAVIADNIAYEPYAFLTAHLRGNASGLTVTNNLQLETADWISQSSADYDTEASPWSYQQWTASGWTNLPLDALTGTYRDGDVDISRFELVPGASSSAGLAWTAPRAGNIAIRSFPVSRAGSANVSITVNGIEVAFAAVDEQGVVLLADDITVQTGDVVRFVVPAGGPAVSWTPSVSFTGEAESTDVLGEWSFSIDNDAQGWTSNSAFHVRAGSLVVGVTSSGTHLTSPPSLGIEAASSSAIRLRLANRSGISSGRLLFRTDGEDFSENRAVPFHVNPREEKGLAEGFTNLLIPVAEADGWSGRIDQIRIELAGGEGEVRIDSVQFANPAGPRWDFNNDGGWKINPDISCASPGIRPLDPEIDINNGDLSTSRVADINWNKARSQTFKVSTGTLAQLEVWAYKTGNPTGCLYIRVADSNDNALFTGAVPPSEVSTNGNFISVYPRLTGLDPNELYNWQIFSPYVIPNGGNYGIGYDDTGRYTDGNVFYSIDGRGIWRGPEGSANRSMRFRTYSATQFEAAPGDEGYTPVVVADGKIVGSGGYEPALLSPDGLGIDAAAQRYVHIRMSNPDNRLTAYLLFTTSDAPAFDIPEKGFPPANEVEGRGIVFPLVPGGEMVDYVLDMSTIPAWTGTIERLMIQPSYRWNYRIGSLASTWSGSIDWVFVDDGETAAVTPAAPGAEGGVESVDVSAFTPGATLNLYLADDTLKARAESVTEATYTFRDVLPDNLNYYVTQTVNGKESVNSNSVLVSLREPTVHAGIGYVDVGNVHPEATVSLYGEDDNLISDSPTIQIDGSHRFAGLTAKASYYAIQSVNGVASAPSALVKLPPLPAMPVVHVPVVDKPDSIGNSSVTSLNGQTVFTVKVNPQRLADMLAGDSSGTVVTIAGDEEVIVFIGQLDGRMVKQMEEKSAVLEVRTKRAVYTIPAGLLNIDALAAQLGSSVALEDIVMRIEVAQPPQDSISSIENAARRGGFALVAPPLSFTVTASYGDKSIEVDKFNEYVQRAIAIPDDANPNRITTGVALEADGTVRHIPTKIAHKNGVYWAEISSLTNSIYSVVWNPQNFADVAGHWSKAEVNDMGSRLIVNGVGEGKFNPDQKITRAEFAAIMVRGLGLKPMDGNSVFSDVNSSDWHSSYILAAHAYGLVNGYEDGRFRPHDFITREQAMVMMAKAMAITGLKDRIDDQSEGSLERYSDASAVSAWARSAAVDCVESGIIAGRANGELAPGSAVTRAEAAAVVRRLLQESGFIQ